MRKSHRMRRSRVRRNRHGRLRANVAVYGKDIFSDVLLPIGLGAGALVLTRWLSTKAYESRLPVVSDTPGMAEVTTAAAVGLTALAFAESMPPESALAKHADAVLVGSSLTALGPALAMFLKIDPIRVASAATQAATQAAAQPTSGLGQGFDISHYGAPYKGMLGYDESAFSHDDQPPAVSIVTPTDVAMVAPDWPQTRQVRERLASPQDRAWAGGIFVRDLFSGEMG